MANSDTIQVSSLPLPPLQYINLYTDENVRRGRAPRPPPPILDSYSMFGNGFTADDTIIRPLEAQGIRRLYPQHFDRRRELKKLNHSLLANFLDLIDLLVQETLRVMMELQKRQRIETALRFQKHLDRVQKILQHALQTLPDTSELDCKLSINTETMECSDSLSSEQQNADPCCTNDRIMCKMIDDMMTSNIF
ncbi:hypothetical protein G9C98_006890 [Cotesia typhae]|uniref:Mediator of RNA polymerase II transcription subunit 7 n=1 Tax=Cotesia typhae TaxID=2053667 RepID=A0A8J5R241_9HYME|nr:hypothetical protein G9C98_006890 [Cotesia typhae]